MPNENPEKPISKMAEYAFRKMQEVDSEGERMGKNSIIVGRNDIKQLEYPRNRLCPCGSGKKYKRCHRVKDLMQGNGNETQ